MSEPDEHDEIGRELDAIFAEFFGPPTEMDLRGVDPATFALGLSYGFDSWQHARVVANNRRHVATAAQHWAEHHPSPEFLSHAAGTDESAVRHRELLDRAHPGCTACEEQLQRLAGPDLDRVDPLAPPDDIDLAWLAFQPVEVVRRLDSQTETARPLHIRGRAEDRSITAEPYGMAINPSHPEFVQFVNAVLAQVRANGTWTQLYNTWLSSLGPAPTPPVAVYKS